jgi:hypothetical protein
VQCTRCINVIVEYMFIYVYTYYSTAHAYRELMEYDWICMCIQIYVFEIGAHAYNIDAYVCKYTDVHLCMHGNNIYRCMYACVNGYLRDI